MNLLRNILLIFFFSLSALSSNAQFVPSEHSDTSSTQHKFHKENVFFGGTGGLQVGQVSFIDISPLIGYKFTNKFQAGTGITYQYMGFKDPYSKRRYNANNYGGRVFSRYFVWKGLFAHAEMEAISIDSLLTYSGSRELMVRPLIGGGISNRLGPRFTYNLTLLYDVNYTSNADRFGVGSPFVIRIGFIY